MSFPVRRLPAVEVDILDAAVFIGRDSRDQALRFLAAVEESIEDLRRFPRKGSLKPVRAKQLAGLRTWFVRGFRGHLIFYVVRPDHIHVLAIFHGSRNYNRLLRQRLPG